MPVVGWCILCVNDKYDVYSFWASHAIVNMNVAVLQDTVECRFNDRCVYRGVTVNEHDL